MQDSALKFWQKRQTLYPPSFKRVGFSILCIKCLSNVPLMGVCVI